MGSKESFILQREIDAADQRGAPTPTVQLRSYANKYHEELQKRMEVEVKLAKLGVILNRIASNTMLIETGDIQRAINADIAETMKVIHNL